jgi:hypothetical protein
MDRDARAYLWDVQQAAEAIGQFMAGLDVMGTRRTSLSALRLSASSKSSVKR